MPNTIDAYCSSCGSFTYFVFDGEDWECKSCGSYNSHGDNCDFEIPYEDE